MIRINSKINNYLYKIKLKKKRSLKVLGLKFLHSIYRAQVFLNSFQIIQLSNNSNKSRLSHRFHKMNLQRASLHLFLNYKFRDLDYQNQYQMTINRQSKNSNKTKHRRQLPSLKPKVPLLSFPNSKSKALVYQNLSKTIMRNKNNPQVNN